MGNMDLRTEIQQRLQAFGKGNLRDNALVLLGTLGYTSEKRITLSPNNLEQFLATFDAAGVFRKKEARDWKRKSVDFLFQLTDDEIKTAGGQGMLGFDSSIKVDNRLTSCWMKVIPKRAPDNRPVVLRASRARGDGFVAGL